MSYLPHKDDNYLAPHEYLGFEIDSEGFSSFQHPENKEYYFAYFIKDKLILRSEGYDQARSRDNGIASVKKYKEEDVHYNIRQHPDGKWVLELRAGNNKEIARTPRVDTKQEALTYMPSALKISMAEPSELIARDDDYLACKEYNDRERSDEFKDFTVFEQGGEHYFALVDEEGEVLLRGEGYMTKEARTKGMESVVKNKGDKERYKIEEHLGFHFVILRAMNNKEIARSCPKTEAAALALITLLTSGQTTPQTTTGTPVAAFAAIDTPEATTAASYPPEDGGSGMRWWWWILIILLLLVLIFFIWKSCDRQAEPKSTDLQQSSIVYASEHDCHWKPVLFGINSDIVDSIGRLEVAGAVEELNQNRNYRGLFIGFSDSTGAQSYNRELSLRRAEAVKAVAIEMGINASRISTSEQDEYNPVATNREEAGRKYNRRVVMYVFDDENRLVCRQQELEVPEELKAD